MPLPDYVGPVLAVAGAPALLFVILRSFPHAARALVVLLAGIVAISTSDKDRRDACHKVLNTLARRDGDPPPLP